MFATVWQHPQQTCSQMPSRTRQQQGKQVASHPVGHIHWQGMYLWSQFFQILVPICKICQKTHLRSFSHKKLEMPKILANPISHGKNFGDVFSDLFHKSEQESEKIVTIDTFLTEIPD